MSKDDAVTCDEARELVDEIERDLYGMEFAKLKRFIDQAEQWRSDAAHRYRSIDKMTVDQLKLETEIAKLRAACEAALNHGAHAEDDGSFLSARCKNLLRAALGKGDGT